MRDWKTAHDSRGTSDTVEFFEDACRGGMEGWIGRSRY